MIATTRVYPACCTSAFCGKGPESCPACRNWPVLREFKEWVKKTDAKVTDPIWCPMVYQATRGSGSEGMAEPGLLPTATELAAEAADVLGGEQTMAPGQPVLALSRAPWSSVEGSDVLRYRHKKTGNVYCRIAAGIDCTNARNGTRVVIYCPENDERTIYVRELTEFCARFDEIVEHDTAETRP